MYPRMYPRDVALPDLLHPNVAVCDEYLITYQHGYTVNDTLLAQSSLINIQAFYDATPSIRAHISNVLEQRTRGQYQYINNKTISLK